MENEITEMAALAAQFVNSTARHVFLTGKAGTGKTTFLRQLAESTHKRYVILAPTGIAALNAGGVTIHSQFLLPFGSFVPEQRLPQDVPEYGNFHDRDTLIRRHPLNAIRRNVLRDVDLLIIDEVSMLRADLLDAIDLRMRSVRQRWDLAFGGAQLLLIGDLYQLPPVVKDAEWNVLKRWYRSVHFFESRALRESGYAHIELDKIFRQKDGEFIRILNNLRDNAVTAEDITQLNTHYKPQITEADSDGVITLTTHNNKAEEINQQALEKLPGRKHSFTATIEGDFPESMFPVLRDLELKVGAQIMFVRNDQEKVYFNGKLARISAIDDDGVEVRMLDDDRPYRLKREVWENKRYVVEPGTREQKEQVLGEFAQYPIKLAWAITVHKSQGLTFDKAIIDVGRAFAPGQVYVALSRLRSLNGLILRTKIDPSVVSSDRDVVAFSESRHAQQPLRDQLREQQKQFLHSMLSSTFDMGDLLKTLEVLLKEHQLAKEFEDEHMRNAIPLLQQNIKGEEANSIKFQHQLSRLLHENDRTGLLDRIEKGAGYYSRQLKENMKALLQHIAQAQQLSRSKQYVEDLQELDGLLVKKLAMIARAVHITTCILKGEEVCRDQELERSLASQRIALLEEVRTWAIEHAPRSATKTGRRRKAALYDERSTGPDLTRKKREKKVKGATYMITYALLNEGKTIAEAAAERGLSIGTIEGHAARGITEGALQIDRFIPVEDRDRITNWMQDHSELGMNEARANFGGTYSYGQLRMVQAWLKKERDGGASDVIRPEST